MYDDDSYILYMLDKKINNIEDYTCICEDRALLYSNLELFTIGLEYLYRLEN